MSRKQPIEGSFTTPTKKSKSEEQAGETPSTSSPFLSAAKEVRKSRDKTLQDYLQSVECNKILFKKMRASQNAYSVSLEHEKGLLQTLQGLNTTIDLLEKATAAGMKGHASQYAEGFTPFIVGEDKAKPVAAVATGASSVVSSSLYDGFDDNDDEMANHEVEFPEKKVPSNTAGSSTKDHQER